MAVADSNGRMTTDTAAVQFVQEEGEIGDTRALKALRIVEASRSRPPVVSSTP